MSRPEDSHFRIIIAICAITAAALLPFSVQHLLARDWLMVASTGGLNVIMAGLAAWLYLRRDDTDLMRRAGYVIVALANVTVAISVSLKGWQSIYWIYPVLFANFYVYPIRVATLLGTLLSVACFVMAAPSIPWLHQLRVVVTLPLSLLFGVVFSASIVTQRRKLQQLANVDSLTGTGNRHSLDMALADAVARHERYGERSSLLIFDIDRFKSINDLIGHIRADEVIAELAAMVAERIRTVDRLYRFGGEEFVLILPHAGERPSWQLAEALRLEIEDHEFRGGHRITVSVGVAAIRAKEGASEWLHRADAALYRAKAAGRNCVMAAVGGELGPEHATNGPEPEPAGDDIPRQSFQPRRSAP